MDLHCSELLPGDVPDERAVGEMRRFDMLPPSLQFVLRNGCRGVTTEEVAERHAGGRKLSDIEAFIRDRLGVHPEGPPRLARRRRDRYRSRIPTMV